jgi:CRISPR/Cas system type I-B associated protein Csh2 (Cas7 group RAMP superfamily)
VDVAALQISNQNLTSQGASSKRTSTKKKTKAVFLCERSGTLDRVCFARIECKVGLERSVETFEIYS